MLLRGAQLNENDKIHKLQKHTVQIITSSNYLAHSEPIFKQLYILKCIDIYKCQLLKFIFKLVHKQLPYYLNLLPFAFNNQHHHHATRTSHNIYIPRVNHVFSKRNIKFSAAFTYNTTPDCIITKLYTHSFKGFSILCIKRQIINVYRINCSIMNCYVCLRQIE